MTTFFITGGFGFLGQYIVQALHDYDPEAELRVLGRTQRKTLLGVENLENAHWIRGDLTQSESFRAELENVDAIVHNAALVSFRKSDAEVIYQANVIGTRNLAQAALDAGCENFIFISSISAVGFKSNGTSDETALPDMEYKREHDMYGYSKRTSEIELKELADRMCITIRNPRPSLTWKAPRGRPVFFCSRTPE